MTYPVRRDKDDVKKEREEFAETIKSVNVSKLVPLDESSVNLAYSRDYGRALTSERIHEGREDVRFERESVLSAMRLNGEMCPFVFSGTLNKELFAEYIKKQLAPFLAKDEVLLLDNSSVHKSKLALDTLRECGIKYIFIPRYSPDFNPIELFWAYMKSGLRKLKARTRDKLYDAIGFIMDSLPPTFVEHWFMHCRFYVNL
jgi:transposase